MTLSAVVSPYQPINGLTGLGLNDGALYIGLDGMDPETNPQQCYWDAAATVPAAQPIQILGGYPMRLGTPTRLFTGATYSIRVRDASGSQVFYEARAVPAPSSSDGVFRSLADAAAATIPPPVQLTGVTLLGYYAPGDGGGGVYTFAAVQAAGAGKFRSLDGAWWELATRDPTIAQFGARPCSPANPTAGPDCQSAVSNCAAFANARGLIARLPAGHWYVSTPPDVLNGLVGAGPDVSFLHYPAGVNGIYCVGSPTSFRASLRLEGFTLKGPLWQQWLTYRPTSTETGIVAAYYNEVYSDIRCQWVNNVSLSLAWCGQVVIPKHRAEYGGRDGAYIGGCGNVTVGMMIGKHLDDDVISFHELPNNTGFAPPSPEILSSPPFSNRIITIGQIHGLDTKGPRFLGAVETVVSTIHMVRPKEHGGYFGGASVSEGLNDPLNWRVGQHIVADVIDGAAIIAAGGLNSSTDYAGIYISSDGQSTGGVTPVAPGLFDTASHAWVIPDGYWYKTNTTAAAPRGGTFLSGITDAKVMQTLPATAHYTDWGVGPCFTGAGWLDPVMTGHARSAPALKLGAAGTPLTDVSINLEAYNVSTVVDLSNAGHISHVKLRLRARRVRDFGVNLGAYTGPENGNVDGLLDITGDFDLDPYLEHSNRNADGTWAVTGNGPFVFGYGLGARLSNVRLSGCTFRNLCSVFQDSNDMEIGNTGLYYDNVYICQPDTSGSPFSAGNKGIRAVTAAAVNRFIVEDSDPTSATYGKRIFCQGVMAAFSIPTTGWYFKGQIVRNETPAVLGGVGTYYTVHGWMRVTSGPNNVLNSGAGGDWVELRCPVDH